MMGTKYLYTTNEEMMELEDRDMTTSITGYVESITSPAPASKNNNEMLFKFVLSNGSKRITVLVWGKSLINKYSKDISFRRVLNINGGHCKAVSETEFRRDNNYVPFEIIIRENTEVTLLGYHVMQEDNQTLQKATFDNLHTMEGLVEISGYIRTKFSLIHTRSGLLSYGLGAITDGTKKVTIHVKKFENSNLEIGDFVTVSGNVTGQDSLVVVFCDSIENVKYDPETKSLPKEDVQRGGRPVKRVRKTF